MVKSRGPTAPVEPKKRDRVSWWGEREKLQLTLQGLEAVQRNSTGASHKLQQTSSLLIVIRLHCLERERGEGKSWVWPMSATLGSIPARTT